MRKLKIQDNHYVHELVKYYLWRLQPTRPSVFGHIFRTSSAPRNFHRMHRTGLLELMPKEELHV